MKPSFIAEQNGCGIHFSVTYTMKVPVHKIQPCCINCFPDFANPSCILWMQTYQILGAYAQLRKTTNSFMYVRPSAWNNPVPTRRIFKKFDIFHYFSKTVLRKFKLH